MHIYLYIHTYTRLCAALGMCARIAWCQATVQHLRPAALVGACAESADCSASDSNAPACPRTHVSSAPWHASCEKDHCSPLGMQYVCVCVCVFCVCLYFVCVCVCVCVVWRGLRV
jgi:hypothetical protein